MDTSALFDADRVCFHKTLIILNSNIVSHRSENEEKGKMKNKTTVLTSIALMLLILASSIYILPAKAAAPADPLTYISETIGEPMTQDPGTCYDTASIELLMNTYEPLLFWDFAATGVFIPMIAESWWGDIINEYDPTSGLTYTQKWTFKIREGVHFQRSGAVTVPGEYHEVDVEDVEYSFERNMVLDSAVGGEILIWDPLLHIGAADLDDPAFGAKIDRAVRSDPVARTISFYLLTPFEPFLQVVAQTYGAIMCKEWLTDTTLFTDDPGTTEVREDNWPGTWGDYSASYWVPWHDPAVSPIDMKNPASGVLPRPHLDCILGTGPYMLDYWDKGAGGEFKLIKNPDYWKGWAGSHVDNFIQRNVVDWDLRKADFLAGEADIVVVPRAYMDQVLGAPGIRCLKDLEDLGVTAEFFGQDISPASQFIGNPPANGTFASDGFPCNGFTDEKLRKAFRALFNFNGFLEAAYQNEAVQPASCVAKGLAYYDPAIVKPAFDRTLAIKLLKEAWGGSEVSPGPVWTNGFTMGFVYNSGNVARQIAAEMLRDEFASLSAEFFPGDPDHFNGIATGQPWSGTAYRLQWQSHQLPFYSVGWGADFPDAHNYVVPFMDGQDGAFAKFQGCLNETLRTWIRNGIDTIVPSERQYWYTLLQQAYVDNCYSFMLSQATLRRFERDWVQGWFYHPVMTTEEYVYDRWKEDPATVTRDTAATISLAQGSNGKRIVVIENTGEDTELVEYNEVISSDGTPISTLKIEVWLRPGAKHVNAKNIFAAGHITITATVRITTKWIVAIGTVNPATVVAWKVGDLGGGVPPRFFNFDGKVDGKDLSLFLQCLNRIAPPEAMCLGDLGSGPPPTFFAFDGQVDGWDLVLFQQCFGGPPTNFYDLAVTSVTLSKTVVGQGYSLNINVTAANQGDFTETFNVTVYANTTTIETKEVTLTSENSTTITFTWNTTGFAKGNYTISAVADTVPGEMDTADNNCSGGWIRITKVGDLGSGPPPTFFACDGVIDAFDFALWKACYDGIASPNAMYLADLGTGPPPTFFACDGVVDAFDFALWKACYDGLGPDP
jgi:peptide/nickel transport system substrate-binding protein